jgi:CheY-like chemotaxis protein
MDAVGRLAAGVAHDFNNLLTIIIGSADVMQEQLSVSGDHATEIRDIMLAAESASSLTKQLLAFSRQQVLDTAAFDVNGLLTDMTGMLGRIIDRNIEVTLNLAPDLSPALADRGQLEQIVMNLVVNARDAMPDGGRLIIETANVELENSVFHAESIVPGHYVMASVTDTGSGMSLETQRRLFEPFYTTKELGKGTGLGLSTTYGIVKQSKGHIWVYSEIGRGTTFKVYLPSAMETPVVPIVAPVAVVPTGRATETILLVEDEESVRRLVRRILDGAGYNVLEAANGEQAERSFAEHGESIGLVVTDMIMPGMTGPELIGRLRTRTPALRALVMSGYTDQTTLATSGVDCSQAFLQKPFTGSELMRQVRALLDCQ